MKVGPRCAAGHPMKQSRGPRCRGADNHARQATGWPRPYTRCLNVPQRAEYIPGSGGFGAAAQKLLPPPCGALAGFPKAPARPENIPAAQAPAAIPASLPRAGDEPSRCWVGTSAWPAVQCGRPGAVPTSGSGRPCRAVAHWAAPSSRPRTAWPRVPTSRDSNPDARRLTAGSMQSRWHRNSARDNERHSARAR